MRRIVVAAIIVCICLAIGAAALARSRGMGFEGYFGPPSRYVAAEGYLLFTDSIITFGASKLTF